MGRGSIDHLMEIGWIKPSGRKNVPGKPALWVTTDLFMEHFGIENISDLPNKEELKASGFLEKRSAIAKITDIASIHKGPSIGIIKGINKIKFLGNG